MKALYVFIAVLLVPSFVISHTIEESAALNAAIRALDRAILDLTQDVKSNSDVVTDHETRIENLEDEMNMSPPVEDPPVLPPVPEDDIDVLPPPPVPRPDPPIVNPLPPQSPDKVRYIKMVNSFPLVRGQSYTFLTLCNAAIPKVVGAGILTSNHPYHLVGTTLIENLSPLPHGAARTTIMARHTTGKAERYKIVSYIDCRKN